MTVLVVGASGATGRLLVTHLLEMGKTVKIIVRSSDNLPTAVKNHENLSIIKASVIDLSETQMKEIVRDCTAVASCLGHNLTFKGIYGRPRRLVTEATRRLCQAIQQNRPADAVKYVLMNTTGNQNRDLNEPISFAQKCVIALLRLLLPPHVDNEKAADFLRTEIGQTDRFVEWTAVRPDGLINEGQVTDYEIHPSPTRSAIFDAGSVSRINVGHFMASLIIDIDIWRNWQGQMPVIYSTEK